jgi:hypothetical protein
MQAHRMGGLRYRSYVVRTWTVDEPDPPGARARIEWIGPGIEIETRGSAAADLAAWLERAFASDAPASDANAPGPQDRPPDQPLGLGDADGAIALPIGDAAPVGEGGGG